MPPESQAATVLCQRLLYEHFGDQVGAVGSILLERGRLSMPQINNLLPEMPARQRSICLLNLIQHNCVFHSTAIGPRDEPISYYEASSKDILARLRHGRVLALHRSRAMEAELKAKSVFPDMAYRLVEELLDHGKLRLKTLVEYVVGAAEAKEEPSDPMSLLSPDEEAAADPKGKRKADNPWTRTAALDAIRCLLSKRYLRVVTVRSHLSEGEREIEKEKGIREYVETTYGKMATAKQVTEGRKAKAAIDEELMHEAKQEEEDYAEALVGEKRKANGYAEGSSSHAKRFRSNAELNEDCYLRVNVDRYMLATRDKQVLDAVKIRYGPHARDVVAAMIVALGEDAEATNDGGATMSRGLTATQISFKLSDKFLLTKKHRPLPFPETASTSRSGGGSSSQDTWSRPEDDDRAAYVTELCKVMSAQQVDPRTASTEQGLSEAFISPTGHHRPWIVSTKWDSEDRVEEKWKLDWGAIASSLKFAILIDLVRKRLGSDHGEIAVRIVNLVDTKGKMDEKHLCKVALVNPKTVRSVLSELSTTRILDTQEVARSKTDRSRSIFLYYLDPDNWQAVLLGEVYQALGNLLTRAGEERHRCKAQTDKLDRPEVGGDASMLADGDRAQLAKLNVKLELLYSVLMRTDEDRWILESAE